MTDYEQGFVEGLQAACILAEAKHSRYGKDMNDKSMSKEDQEAALNCYCVMGQLICDIKLLGTQVHRKQIMPDKIAKANGPPFWWATPEGKGRS